MKTAPHIGVNIHKYRTLQGLSQQQVAEYLGVTRELISFVEGGKRNLSISKLNRLSDLFGIELVDLIEEDPQLQDVNLAFAFRTDEIDADLNNIAAFRRIVLNYFKIERLSNDLQD